MVGIRSFMFSFVMVLLCAFSSFAAQSTKDISASDDLKIQAKKTVLGGSGVVKPQDPEYVIGHGDFLEVQVYGEGSMAVSAPTTTPDEGSSGADAAGTGIQVRIDGRVSLKHIGDVEVVDMTLTQMADYLKLLYATVYDDPIVTVVLKKSNSKLYTVMGKVVNPGIYNIDQPINLVQVIARSGGFTEWANSELTVVRENGSKSSPMFSGNTLKFDYDDFLDGRNLEKNIVIKSGDIIIVH
ncbi:polysaccharide biosynthesis/export family protein [Desulfopila aestuarii]|uniref:Polysaccharide export outer membrane protein n=1 Tax=Desulfopila aestuarii DSM 18488 TaxID=1121416 RepID=A0A1M7Y2S7_9BACT|nr:polysaccharide biosynthesis/export family protein [Desulfopila aestuarii]SHO46111.1 polysaccharide export outer membrane protein [Desulfopila aestuarii DSM 18488]